ncbi:unnamed protein product [Blepharisma stoltei]|uniref:Uncharacterized protein n=1 Tax=Blepharisma stoltei TaxID=1481888 RepID=A0AAU9IZW0_9CILI|nr:unnamed protein product [Blepharisma stoltei]
MKTAKNKLTPEDSNTGRWTQREHKAFLLGIKLYGKDWKNISEYIGTRTSDQVRSHAQKYYLRIANVKKYREEAQDFVAKEFELIEGPRSHQDQATQYGEGMTFSDVPLTSPFDSTEYKK